ncbi:dimethylaniline monooxygenase [N-oxide-forming] 4-like [Heteronotia binoei]|uniref:dimethylaniline monooxygenase [N-oxide-forming] 4-like n=1 Tax=Heteronotia binoei TaxID=13085 RepID=UPI00292F0278|nr:dimethylaniline monooxygenase [N-oxide-forming] 4-like [Heteronotia binoei]
MAQKVAIIGAGVSGLASLKCCLDEGLEPTCFEKSDDIGGLWQFREIPEEGRTNVYKSVITNTSKEMTAFSDFPFPEGCPNYLHHSLLLEYLRMYAEHFQLLNYIHLKTTVFSIQKHPDFAATGQWVVCTKKDGQQESAIFDAVMICSGRYAELNLPLDSFPGIKKFQGCYLHSWEYKDETRFEGKRVLVLGAGNSGGDIAAEVSRTAAKVFLSTRSGTWVLSRISDAGWPFDMVFTNRFMNFIRKLVPAGISKRMLAKIFGRWFSHENYGLIPLESSWIPLILNDELPSRILCGSVVVKPNVKEFTESAAIFEDGTVEKDIDAIIFATGYKPSFHFLEESLHSVCRNNMSLYKQIFPPHLERHTLAIIGFIAVTGSIMPAVELQARWVTKVFKGSRKLPAMNHLISEIAKQKEDLRKQGIPTDKDKVRTSFIDYMDEIATCVGVKPSMPLLFLTDPKLAFEVFFGPCTSYQYRLTGPGKWEKARTTILTQWDRALKPLKTRVIVSSSKHSSISCWLIVLALPIFLGTALFTCKYSPPSWLPWIK